MRCLLIVAFFFSPSSSSRCYIDSVLIQKRRKDTTHAAWTVCVFRILSFVMCSQRHEYPIMVQYQLIERYAVNKEKRTISSENQFRPSSIFDSLGFYLRSRSNVVAAVVQYHIELSKWAEPSTSVWDHIDLCSHSSDETCKMFRSYGTFSTYAFGRLCSYIRNTRSNLKIELDFGYAFSPAPFIAWCYVTKLECVFFHVACFSNS